MKSLSNHIKASMNRQYHLSYDTIDCNKDFNGIYDDAKRFILCVLKNTPIIDISCYCASTLIIEYDGEVKKLSSYLKENLSPYFYYSISLVSKEINDIKNIINHNPNMSLDIEIKREWKKLDFSNLGKNITHF